MSGKPRWKCSECGYELPKGSDLLKICPNCHRLGTFEKIKE
jgi:rubrerythrin